MSIFKNNIKYLKIYHNLIKDDVFIYLSVPESTYIIYRIYSYLHILFIVLYTNFIYVIANNLQIKTRLRIVFYGVCMI